MQFMNDDMDELFRDAAKDYPLKTDGADWNKVLKQLQEGANEPTTEKPNYRNYLWLLLLLPITFICTQRIYNGDQTIQKTSKQQAEGSSSVKVTGNENSISTATKNDDHISTGKEATQYNSSGNNPQPDMQKEALQPEGISKNKLIKSRYAEPIASKASKSVVTKSYKYNEINADNAEINKEWSHLKNNKSSTQKKLKNISSADEPNDIAATDITKNNSTNDTLTNTLAATSQKQKQDTLSSPAATTIKKQQGKNTTKTFYATFLLGPDLSTIKFERIKSSGYSIGLLLGYRFSNKMAVETGVLWDHKNYYSSGEYFNTSKVAIPANVKIINLTGNCGMIEIPLNIKYDFVQKKQSSWFMAAGISSYLMKSEDYTYLYNHNNAQYDVYKNYKNSSTNWLSILNISAGYQHTIEHVGTIGIEPYIKLPLKGVGIGKLPITSTGVYLSITRPLSR